MSFLAELQRRNVIRVAGLYLVGAWFIVQVAGTVLPMFGAPDWIGRSVVVLLAIGSVPVLVFSWAFELTPQGLRRDAEVSREESIAPRTGRRIDRMIIVLLLLALGYFAVDKFVLAPRRDAALRASVREHDTPHPAASPAVPSARSVAVLPFVNMSGEASNEYFSDGITEEILNALAQIPDLKVAARTSAFAFKGKDPDLRKVGEVLDVASVLEGSVQRAGDEVRITAQLIDARSGYHLWSEKYDRKLTSIFAVEDEISKAIADKLKVQFGGARTEAGGTTGSAEAHERYLRGLTLLAARGAGLRDAAAAFGKAVEIDPNYAQAWGALAEADELLPGYLPDVDRDAAMARGESAAQRALAIDPNTSSALVALANVRVYQIQWAQADALYRHALELAPGDAEAIDQYAQFLDAIGEFDAALRQIDHARQLDPLSAIIGTVRAGILEGLQRDADAAAQLESVLSAHPDFYPACMTAALLYIHLQRYADAEAQLRTVARHLGVDADAKAVLARGAADPALRAAALTSLTEAPANADIRGDQLIYAAFLAALDAKDRAFEQLQAFAVRRNAAASGLLWTGIFASLRADPRFKALLEQMRLPYRPAAQSGT